MDWDKIDINAIIFLLRKIEKESVMIDGECSVTYSDGKEELKISYKKLK